MDYGNNKYTIPIPGIKVLVVDCDSTSLTLASKMLRILGYEVVTAKLGSDALSIIEKNELHLVIMEIHLPDMKMFELIDKIRESYDIPSFIMSADENQTSKSKALSKGAKLYFIKPLLLSDLKGLWKFASCNTKVSTVSTDQNGSKGITVNKDQECKPLNNNNNKEKKQELVESSVVQRRKRIRWTDHLHMKFMEAVILAGSGAGPKKIHEYMNVPGVTKEHVSSYLQKYRQSLKAQDSEIQYQRKMLSSELNLRSYQLKDLFHCKSEQFLDAPAHLPSTKIPTVHEPALSQNQLLPGTLVQGEMNGNGVESVEISQEESYTNGRVSEEDQLDPSEDFETIMTNTEPCFTSWSRLLDPEETSYEVSSKDYTAENSELNCSMPMENDMCQQFPAFPSVPSGNVDEIFNISKETENACDEDLDSWLKSL
ncbi:two-component response regulator ORR26-like [Arachis duranensis]|uniref:Two-component response regulator ORR26-like n=1 Tax=Arachis duranensis TaxID=130453 RepID=A0A6P5N8W0_ARADU|nr:two-component response regulator ORR26-like [Arachis duranensis]